MNVVQLHYGDSNTSSSFLAVSGKSEQQHILFHFQAAELHQNIKLPEGLYL